MADEEGDPRLHWDEAAIATNFNCLVMILPALDMNLYTLMSENTEGEQEKILDNFFRGKKGLAFQILCGLRYIHSTGVYHRDLKPQNIFVKWGKSQHDGIVKIGDFGGSRIIHETLLETYGNVCCLREQSE